MFLALCKRMEISCPTDWILQHSTAPLRNTLYGRMKPLPLYESTFTFLPFTIGTSSGFPVVALTTVAMFAGVEVRLPRRDCGATHTVEVQA